MLFSPGLSRYSFTYDNWGTNPSATPGTSVVPGASNAEGLWTQIASAANITQDIHAFMLRVSDGAGVNNIRDHLLDVGVDPAGGTSYAPIISNIVCGQSPLITNVGIGHHFLFPFFIKAGSSFAVRIQGSNTTAPTMIIGAKFYGQPSRDEIAKVGSFSETIGTITGSGGVTFTPGNAADGAWQLLGATTQPLWWWQIAYQVSNGIRTVEYTYIDIAHGDATNKHIIMRTMCTGSSSETTGDVFKTNLMPIEAYCPVPAGTNIYIRGRCNNAPDTGYNAVAIGVGG